MKEKMTREMAAKILDPETSIEAQREYGTSLEDVNEACRMGAEALQPWVRTADRAPTMEDADSWDLVFATHRTFGGEPFKVRYQVVAKKPSDHVWWMPIPPLPEVGP